MWPFGKNRDDSTIGADAGDDSTADVDTGTDTDTDTDSGMSGGVDADTAAPVDTSFDPVEGSFGPFDGDAVNYRDFDFSDFAKGGLDLGSMMIPVPHVAEVQVEMGPDGPRQIHILTPHGRITPAAFAAPRSGGQWAGDIDEFAEGMENDGLQVMRRGNDWGQELVGTVGDGVVRVIGVDAPRWMLRMTLAGPAASTEALAELAYEMISRTFVNRGEEPAPAGRALPVQIPRSMAEELQRAMAQQAGADGVQPAQQAPSAQQAQSTTAPGPQVRRRSGGTVDRRMEGSE